MFAVGLLSKFIHYCDTSHFKAVKRVLRYVRGTTDFGVWYTKANTLKLVRYIDSDWAGLVDDMRSTSEYFFLLGYGVLSWSSKKQSIVSQSTTEAEYIAAAAQLRRTQSSMERQSIFKIKYYFVREVEQRKEVTLVHYNTKTQLADILTKPLGKMRFEKLRNKIGVHNMKANEEFYKMTNHTTCTFGKPSKIGELTVSGELSQMNSKWRAHYFGKLECERGSQEICKLRSQKRCELLEAKP
ncbi:hypothetical protein J1N35_014241 [Gossypium stocksii]|uniref:Reverse transcriptase Ty1/copia-type domain-containing protein n=1 Tax=Gossypium stocksii TaxID=47602 RepID=A0A9D3VUC5_9ROSI|nr:hypothetical protein J1N35_014241 [Gossypium stocksii]